MKKDVEHLLTTRFQVFADYPNSVYEIGDVIQGNCKQINGSYIVFNNYPHLFRKLQWFDGRTEAEMPKYIKSKNLNNTSSYFKIEKWDMENLEGYLDITKNYICPLTRYIPEYNFEPCSEVEYLENVKK